MKNGSHPLLVFSGWFLFSMGFGFGFIPSERWINGVVGLSESGYSFITILVLLLGFYFLILYLGGRIKGYHRYGHFLSLGMATCACFSLGTAIYFIFFGFLSDGANLSSTPVWIVELLSYTIGSLVVGLLPVVLLSFWLVHIFRGNQKVNSFDEKIEEIGH